MSADFSEFSCVSGWRCIAKRGHVLLGDGGFHETVYVLWHCLYVKCIAGNLPIFFQARMQSVYICSHSGPFAVLGREPSSIGAIPILYCFLGLSNDRRLEAG